MIIRPAPYLRQPLPPCMHRESLHFIHSPTGRTQFSPTAVQRYIVKSPRGTREYSQSAAVLVGRKPHGSAQNEQQSKANHCLRHLCEQRDPLVIGEVVHRHQLQLLERAKDLRDDDGQQTNTQRSANQRKNKQTLTRRCRNGEERAMSTMEGDGGASALVCALLPTAVHFVVHRRL
jgi:hypothetical protein